MERIYFWLLGFLPYRSLNDEEEANDTHELLEEYLIRNLTKDYLEFLSKFLVLLLLMQVLGFLTFSSFHITKSHHGNYGNDLKISLYNLHKIRLSSMNSVYLKILFTFICQSENYIVSRRFQYTSSIENIKLYITRLN